MADTAAPLIAALYFLESAIYYELYEPNEHRYMHGSGSDGDSDSDSGFRPDPLSVPATLLKNTG